MLAHSIYASSSHIFQLSLNFVENVVLHLFVLAVTRARAVLQIVRAITVVFLILQALLQSHVQFVPDRHRLSLLTCQRLLMLLNLTVQSLGHCIFIRLLHETLLKFGGAENKANLSAGLLIALLNLLVLAMRVRPLSFVEELQLLQSIAQLLFLSKIVGGHLFLRRLFDGLNLDVQILLLSLLLINLIRLECKFNWADHGPISSSDLL